jgi:hypothetical protein
VKYAPRQPTALLSTPKRGAAVTVNKPSGPGRGAWALALPY